VFGGSGSLPGFASAGAAFTSALLDSIPGAVFTVGDNAYPNGSSTDYTNCYEPTWGRHRARTHPVPGNHEYETDPTAAGYFGYYGAAAGAPGKGYYSYDLGDWHIIALNSELDVSAGSAEMQWLRADLAASTKRCTIALWHEPRFVSTSAGTGHTSDPRYQPLWDTLYRYGAELVVNGHKHSYERLAPQSPTAALDLTYGVREFVVGTGGEYLDGGVPTPIANSEVRNTATWGVLKLTLNPGSYSWQFVPITGAAFSDSGTTACHDVPPLNHAPTAAPGGPYSAAEGTAPNFDGGLSSDPDGDAVTYAWTFGDGATGTGVTPSHAYPDDGTYTATLTVTDSRGASSAPATTTATITNVAPSVNAGANQNVTLGTSVTLSASFSDPGVNDAPWTYTIAWGDGSPQTTGSTSTQSSVITATHTYPATGTDTVWVTVTDKNGGAGSGRLTVTVTATVNQPPTAVPSGPFTGTEGTATSFDGSRSSDPDGDALTYAWSFGDGTTGTGVKPSHAYLDNGNYTVTLTVTDSRGAASSPVTTSATIANVAPAVNAGANQTATVGSPITVSATFSDPGVSDAPWAYAFDWGDGSPRTTGSTTSRTAPVSATHTYTKVGTYTLRITVTDKDGGVGSASKSVQAKRH